MTVQSNNDYWKKRAEIEHKWQLDQLAQDERFNHVLDRSYQVAIDNINKEILANIDKIGGASKLVTAKEMAEYERLAKQTVEHAESLRKQGHKVTYDDFAPEVNERLKVYNATMRINRLEMIKSKIGTHVLDLGMDIQTKTNDKLYNDYLKEMKRQAGILGISAKNSEFWSSTKTIDQVTAQTLTANFNKHLWPNMDVMKADLDGILSTGIIRGDNPREMARWLEKHVSDSVKNKRYVAERLARTESARVQIRAQLRSFKENDYKYCMWHAEPKACEQCSSIARNSDSKSLPNGVYKVSDVPTIPVHPNCRCSLSAYWVDGDELNSNNEYENSKEAKITQDSINDYGVNKDLVNSKAYHDKFEKLPYSKLVREALYMIAITMLEHRNNTNYEDLAAIDARTGQLIVQNTDSNVEFKSGFNKKQHNKFNDSEASKIMIHNHPTSSRPSDTDFITAEKNNLTGALIIGHDGTIYSYSVKKDFEFNNKFKNWYNIYRKNGYPNEIAYSKAMDKIIKMRGVKLEKY